MDEFELIRRFFDRKGEIAAVSTGIGDDGAVLSPNTAKQQVQVIDTLVEDVHFPKGTDPADIAYRAVAVNLSDIAAMGGTPRWMSLALTLDDASEAWIAPFARGLFEAADEHDVALVGGDTTSGPTLTVTVTITGEVEIGTALLRSGAKFGDSIYVTGNLGDAALGLRQLQGGEVNKYLAQRFLRPTPRVDIGRALVGKANSAIDVSDGLAADLKKLLTASGVGGEIDMARLPLSDELQEHAGPDEHYLLALCGGDDYELCFTASPENVKGIHGITQIGVVTKSPGLICRLHGNVVEVDDSGYRHFT
jgi:thiamine-monophosphate kinase